MAKTKLYHALNCYLLTGGAGVEPFCSCGVQKTKDEIDRLKTKLKTKNKRIKKLETGIQKYLDMCLGDNRQREKGWLNEALKEGD